MSDVRLTIPNDTSKGLSHAIDAALDEEFTQKYGNGEKIDVNLSGYWQSIFNTIKANQAEQEAGQRTFGEKDIDVTKGSQYKVNAGNYIIKESVWNSIVDLAKEVTGIQQAEGTPGITEQANPTETAASPTAATSALETSGTDVANDEELKTKLQSYVENYSNEPSLLQYDLLDKYKVMLEYAKANNQTLTDDEIKTRLNNYVKGWKFHSMENRAMQQGGTNPLEVHNEDATEEQKTEGLEKLADEYIEFYDRNGDGKIDKYENLYESIKDYYMNKFLKDKPLTRSEATRKAIQMVEDYKNGKLKPDKNGNDEEQLLSNLLDNMDYLDSTTLLDKIKQDDFNLDDFSSDGYLEKKDIVALLDEIKGDDNKISSEELRDFNYDMIIQKPERYQNLFEKYTQRYGEKD